MAKKGLQDIKKKNYDPSYLSIAETFHGINSVLVFFLITWFNDCVLGKSSEISCCESNTCEG